MKKLWFLTLLVIILQISNPVNCELPRGIVHFKSAPGFTVEGDIVISATEHGISIKGKITGLTPGLHGFHVHEKGDLGNGCKNALGHFNPFNYDHGDPRDLKRHIGDLGNIEADETGVAPINILDNQASMNPQSKAYIGNRAIVIHSGADDLGRGGNPESLKTGNAGSRVACGVIEIQEEVSQRREPLPVDSQSREAHVVLVPGSNPKLGGNLRITSNEEGILIEGRITGLAPGLHGFHIHEKGDLGNECKNALGHFNPFGATHGAPTDSVRHVGDFGNIEADESGTANIYFLDVYPSLDNTSEAYIGNLSFVVHAGVDDLGKGGNPESLKTGNAGARDGCGIINIQPRQPQQQPDQELHQQTIVEEFDHVYETPIIFPVEVPSRYQNPHFATITIVRSSSGEVAGELTMNPTDDGVLIQGKISGLTPGLHGFHIHEKGDLGNQCKNAGGHFNPFGQNHGAPEDPVRHVGDFGNIEADENGIANIHISDPQPSLDPQSETYVGNLSIVVHDLRDDLGRGGNPESLITGNAGSRVACGLIKPQEFDVRQEPQDQKYPAIVKFIPGSNSNLSGELSITSLGNGILIEGNITGLTPGLHGFHVHEKSNLGNGCKDAGGHFNPFNANHGAPDAAERHVGDFGNIEADETGTARVRIQDSLASLKESSQTSIINRAIVIHALPDDLGRGGNPESLKTGNAGARIGCGVVVVPQFTDDRRLINAAVKLKRGSSLNLGGELQITAVDGGVLIEGEISGLTPGLHGFHIHDKGDLGNECKNAGPHFNPFNLTHGDPKSEERHVGDLGNIEANENGIARIQIFDAKASFESTNLAYIGNRSIVVHADKDDLGLGGNIESLKTGNAGSRLGCGIIVILQEQPTSGPYDQMQIEDSSEATVEFVPGSDLNITGKLTLTKVPDGILIEGHINNISPGLHGFHIHENGDLGNECKSAGGHFNPFNLSHGEPNSDERHVGDFGNIVADDSRTARIHIFDPIASMDPSSPAYIGNRSFVVHAKPDDLGKGGDPESLKTGNAGSRLGCGLIVIRADQIHQQENQQQQPQQPQQPQQHQHYRRKRNLYTNEDNFSSQFNDPFDFSATSYFGGQGESARVKIVPGTSKSVRGDLHIMGVHGGVVIKGTIYGLTPGLHGFHFHEKGDLGNKCQNAGGHFNPFQTTHGDRHDFERHVGDLGNIKADAKGVAHIDIFDRKASLNPHSQSFVGHIALVVHADPDDLGRGGNDDSKRTGNSGVRVGCGLVRLDSKHQQQDPFGHLSHQQIFDSPYKKPQRNVGFQPHFQFQNHGHGLGFNEQNNQNQENHHPAHQGSQFHDVPVYTPSKPPRLDLSFNFGPPHEGGFRQGHGFDY